ncbi:MAG: copper homeostasis protein [Acidobacteria bacterium]|nr:MAG: copper homeostasis protein [Acidobacteriota bacterium]
MKKNIYTSLTLLLLLTAACQCNKKASVTDRKSAGVPLSYEGLYKGTLPCADCMGIEVKLTLNRDKTYVYEEVYIDKTDMRFTYTGSYTVKENILTIKENERPVYFLIEGQVLKLLDGDLKPAQGVLAPLYQLKKT